MILLKRAFSIYGWWEDSGVEHEEDLYIGNDTKSFRTMLVREWLPTYEDKEHTQDFINGKYDKVVVKLDDRDDDMPNIRRIEALSLSDKLSDIQEKHAEEIDSFFNLLSEEYKMG